MYSIAVLTASHKSFEKFMYSIYKFNGFKLYKVSDLMSINGVSNWIGWIELHDSQDIDNLPEIKYNIEIRKIKVQ